MSFPTAHLVELGDRGHGPITLSVHESGAASDRPAVIFSHGFPELGYSWRHQVPAVADAGFRALAPDQRGYGASSAPEAIDAYDIEALCGDLDAMCESLGIERAVFVGHDWGGAVVWAMPEIFPDRVAGVVGICTPYIAFPGTDFLKMLVDGDIDRQYMLWFQEPGVAEAVLDDQVELVFRKLMVGGVDPAAAPDRASAGGTIDMNPFRDLAGLNSPGAPIATEAELQHYIDVFNRTGFRGGINWYRNLDRNREIRPRIGTFDPAVPCLMITAEWDPVLPPAFAAGMVDQIADLEYAAIEKVGHWVPQEAPIQVSDALVDWLSRRFA